MAGWTWGNCVTSLCLSCLLSKQGYQHLSYSPTSQLLGALRWVTWRHFTRYKTRHNNTLFMVHIFPFPCSTRSLGQKSEVLIPGSARIMNSSLIVQFKGLAVKKEARVLPQRQQHLCMSLVGKNPEAAWGQTGRSWTFVCYSCVLHKALQGQPALAVPVCSKVTCILSGCILFYQSECTSVFSEGQGGDCLIACL